MIRAHARRSAALFLLLTTFAPQVNALSARATRLSEAPPNIRVAATIRITLESGTSTTVSIPVPASLRASDSVSFHVNRALAGAVGGAGDGTFMSADATVPLLIRARVSTAVGVHRLADVRFWAADGTGDRIIVPIELTVTASSAVSAAAALPEARARANRVVAAVTLDADPRSIHLVRIAPPFTLGARDSVAYSVHREPGAVVGGPSAGVVAGADSRVMLSVSVPSKALAGTLRLAEVRFHVPAHLGSSGETVVVPVEVMVAPVRAISITPAAPIMHVMPGRRTAVRVIIANGGNIEDTVSLSLALPAEWRGRLQQSARIALAPGASVTRDVEVTVPRDHVAGSSSVQLYAARLKDDATTKDAAARTLSLPVEVLSASRGGAFGPMLGLSYNAVQQPGQGYLDSWGFTLTGPISSRINVSAAWTQRAVGGAPGLSRIGGGQAFPTIAFIHPNWRVDAGNAATDFGDMGGLTRSGRGVSATVGDTTWQLSALAARPFTLGLVSAADNAAGRNRSSLIVQYGGVLAGLRARAVRGNVAYTASASHLRDPLITRAELDAFAVGAERVGHVGVDARGELAYRQWADGRGVGAAAEFGNRSQRNDWRLRATHAPGGSRAFARAQTDVTFTGGQGLGAMRLGYLGWYASDDGDLGVTQQTSGVGLMPQLRLGRSSSLGFEARVGSSRSGDETVQLSTLSQIAGLFGSTRLGVFTASASATYTQLQRDFAYFDSRLPRERESQLYWSTQLLWPTSVGTFDLYSAVQRRSGAAVLSDGQHDMALRAEQIAVPFMDKRLFVNAAVGRTLSLSTGSQVITKRLGLASLLPFQTNVRVDFEHNPAFALSGARGWTTALRVERSFGAPTFLRGGRGMGVVFEDLNGNGVRDRGERGLASVLVRIGGEVVVTERDGSYRLSRPGAGVPELDERSLPFGLMMAPQVGRATAGALRDASLDIPVVPVGAVEVQLDIVRDSVVGDAPLSLVGVSVVAIDESGRRHLATLLPDGRALFDALPPGVYRIDVDGSAAREPLSVQGASPTVRLDGQRARQTVRVLLGPRRVRVFRATPVERSAATGRP